MRYAIFFLYLLPTLSFTQMIPKEIETDIQVGNFTKAQEKIKQHISQKTLSEKDIWKLQLQSEILDRIRLDFNRDEAYIRETLQPYYPNLSNQQLEAWEKSQQLEMRIIDGEKRYFRNAVWNLFRVNEEAKQQKDKVDGYQKSSLDTFLEGYLPGAVNAIKKGHSTKGKSRHFKLTYTLRVKPNVVPDGEMIRAWLPYPRNSRSRLSQICLLDASEANHVLSPNTYQHSTLYMEKRAKRDEWTEFQYQVSYQATNAWQDLFKADIQAYNIASELYQTYTSERDQHIQFTPEIKALSKKIIQGTESPLEKTWRIYQWIGENIPWTSALEYSTIPNIPAYCLANQKGDCGIKALLFITLLRYNGIPAKWQSGWFLYPDNINLHDWAEVYFEGLGWVPMDPDFNLQKGIKEEHPQRFFFGGADAYRLIVNDDFSQPFFPAKIHPRSETVDFQRGEVEWRGGNLYFDKWTYKMEVEYIDKK